MIPKKGGVADRRGIKFSGNPDVKDFCERSCSCPNPSPKFSLGQFIFCRNCGGLIRKLIR